MLKSSPQGRPAPTDDLIGLIEGLQADALRGRPQNIRPARLASGFRSRFAADEISDLIVPKRTLARRIANREALSPEETDRAVRVGSVSLTAERVFADPDKAGAWLRKANPALNAQRPLDLLRTEAGANAVLELLGQIDHGMFA